MLKKIIALYVALVLVLAGSATVGIILLNDYFEEIELSPLFTSKEFPYIPSFARLLSGEENEKIKEFVGKFL